MKKPLNSNAVIFAIVMTLVMLIAKDCHAQYIGLPAPITFENITKFRIHANDSIIAHAKRVDVISTSTDGAVNLTTTGSGISNINLTTASGDVNISASGGNFNALGDIVELSSNGNMVVNTGGLLITNTNITQNTGSVNQQWYINDDPASTLQIRDGIIGTTSILIVNDSGNGKVNPSTISIDAGSDIFLSTTHSDGQIVLTTANSGTYPNNGIFFSLTNGGPIGVQSGTRASILPQLLTNTATLDFSSTGPGASTTLTAALTGVIVGDLIILGIPVASVGTNGVFTAWCDSSNQVTVRYTNTNLVGSVDPPSGVFKIGTLKTD